MPFKTEARPYTYLIAYCTADGKTTPSPKVLERGREAFTQFALAGLQDPLGLRVKVHRLRAAVDAVLVGSRTVWTDNPELTVRFGVEGRDPLRVVLSSRGELPMEAKILDTEKVPTLVAVSRRATPEAIRRLRERGVEVYTAGEEQVDLPNLLAELRLRGVERLMVEGGATVRWSFFRQGLVDEYWLLISPTIWGEDVGITRGEGFTELADIQRLELKTQSLVGGNVVCLEYLVSHAPRKGPKGSA